MCRMLNRWGWLATAGLVCLGCIASAEVVDQTLATVGDEIILQSDVLGELAPDLNTMRAQLTPDEFNQRAQDMIRQGVEQAVEEKLLLREAKLAGVTVEDSDVEKRIEDFKKRYPSTEAFLKDLELYGETQSDLRDSFRKRLMALRMAGRKMEEFSKQVVVSESEVAQYYQDHPEEFAQPESVRVRQIFLPVEPGADPAAVKARIEQLRKDILAGGNFAELAKAQSKGPSASEGGLVGWVKKGDLVEPLEQATLALQPGQVSEVIQTPEGFHLLTADERKDAGMIPFDEARARIEPELRTQAARERYQKWMNDLRARSSVQVFL